MATASFKTTFVSFAIKFKPSVEVVLVFIQSELHNVFWSLPSDL